MEKLCNFKLKTKIPTRFILWSFWEKRGMGQKRILFYGKYRVLQL